MFAGVAVARPHMDARRTRVDAHVPRATLLHGVTMPLVAVGTWQYPPDQAEPSVLAALSVGFEHIDTAFNYRNQVRGFRLARRLAATLSASQTPSSLRPRGFAGGRGQGDRHRAARVAVRHHQDGRVRASTAPAGGFRTRPPRSVVLPCSVNERRQRKAHPCVPSFGLPACKRPDCQTRAK